ncbi:MAG TPA: SOS response-associated peptidase family protein, partial [Steroidobacteraceae bacterium]|nr:SOS response-associated peptidase family protein [Steroidobacteraceae bacterium]
HELNEKQRMPAILAGSDHEAWLRGEPAQARQALKSFPDELMRAWKVSPRVNRPRLPNDASLIDPV